MLISGRNLHRTEYDTCLDTRDAPTVYCIFELPTTNVPVAGPNSEPTQGTRKKPERLAEMPHIVLDLPIDLKVFSENFTDLFIRKPYIIKLQDVFVNRAKKTALLPAVVVDKKSQNFLIEISVNDKKTTVRLFPGTDPEKTDAVMYALGYTSVLIRRQFGQASISKTNISKFIPSSDLQ